MTTEEILKRGKENAAFSGRIQRSYDTREKTGSKIAACSGKDSKDNNSNSRCKSTKEIAALEGLGELQRTYDTRGQTGS